MMTLAIKPSFLLLRWRVNSQWRCLSFSTHDPQWRETLQTMVRNQLQVHLIYPPTKASKDYVTNCSNI